MTPTGLRRRRRSGATSVGRRTRGADPATEVPDLVQRVTEALAVGGDRLGPEARAAAEDTLARVGERAGMGMEHTVVALAGATGSGKSSTFNALCGFDISPVGVRRPTTSDPVACVWGPGSDAVLDWLDVPQRHRTNRDSALDAGENDDLAGLVLLDMPDHDSRETSHRLDVDRLVTRVDMLIWVVDPQKYADDALHTDYLRQLRGHDDVLVVVLNQVDRLRTGEPEQVLEDLRRLVVADGLPDATLLMTSATTGEGVVELRNLVADAVASKAMAAAKARAELVDTLARLRAEVGDDEPDVDEVDGDLRLTRALADAAGVPTVLAAVQADYRRQATRRTGWPFTRWVSRVRPDPMKRLRLSSETVRTDAEEELGTGGVGLARTSMPAASPAQLARVDLAQRQLVESAAEGMKPRWADAVRAAPLPSADLRDALDQAVLSTDLTFRRPRWWSVVGFLQVLLALAALVGVLGLLALFALDFLQVPYPDLPPVPGSPEWLPVPLPTALTVLGLLGGLLLAIVAGAVVPGRARARRRAAGTRLRVAVSEVAREHVLAPVADVLADHRRCRDLLSG